MENNQNNSEKSTDKIPLFNFKNKNIINKNIDSYGKKEIQQQYNINNNYSNYFKKKLCKNFFINNDIFKVNCNLMNNQKYIKNSDNNLNTINNEVFNIVNLLQTNPNITSYVYIIDYLTLEELSAMFYFILNNIFVFASNNQSFILIDKIISLYDSNSNLPIKKKILNDNIFSFLFSFFNKKIFELIKYNNYLSSLLNFVIRIGFPKNDFIFSEIEKEFKKFAYSRQGCIVIQKLFPLGNEQQQKNILEIILEQFNELILDKYGHYLFKYLLYQVDHGEKYYCLIHNKMINDLKQYINNKYSSVVIERLLDSTNEDIKKSIINKICSNEKDVVELAYHSYGNYVLQKIINVTKDKNILEMIYKTIMKNKNSLLKLSYGKNILKGINVAYTLK